jgi:hypothetical protein
MAVYPASYETSIWSPPPFSLRPVVLTTYIEQTESLTHLSFMMFDAHFNYATETYDKYRLACRNICYYHAFQNNAEDGFLVLDLAITNDQEAITKVISSLKHDPRSADVAYWLIQMSGERDVIILCSSINWSRQESADTPRGRLLPPSKSPTDGSLDERVSFPAPPQT